MTLAPLQPAPALAEGADPLTVALGDFMAEDDGKPMCELDDEFYAMLEAGELFPDLPLPDANKAPPPLLGAAAEGLAAPKMVGWDALRPEGAPATPVAVAADRASPSPASSETSYKPIGSDSGSDFTDSPKTDESPRKTAAKTPKVDPRIGRRKPDVDLSSISDVNERRKQRRLAKNRATAATSRARKRALMATLQQRVGELAEENGELKAQLAACRCTRGCGVATTGGAAARTRL